VGGAKLRDGALSDGRVIGTINARFEPVWVNIRTTPVPDRRAIDAALESIPMNGERKLTGSFNQGFFVRSCVLSSDGKRLLNPQGSPRFGDMVEKGHFSYAQVKAEDYLEMLDDALLRSKAD
jgi:hypothetical protein